jgi:hypothetical protein
MKTVQDYTNDPRLLNDPGMAEALESVREIYCFSHGNNIGVF